MSLARLACPVFLDLSYTTCLRLLGVIFIKLPLVVSIEITHLFHNPITINALSLSEFFSSSSHGTSAYAKVRGRSSWADSFYSWRCSE